MKRNLFNELKVGFGALESAREGKITLRQHVVEKKPAPAITPGELLSLREKLHVSRSVFARYLRTNERTLENWEQGRASPNAQAAILIRMVERYPDTVDRLLTI
ncbi:MAG: putative transcriptional regulator [Gallionellaceae bacterium]|nr:MAG: putative transcriptional regulator [Gallionellaceae bacterium]